MNRPYSLSSVFSNFISSYRVFRKIEIRIFEFLLFYVALEIRDCFQIACMYLLLCVCALTCEGGYIGKRPSGCFYSRRQCEAKVGTKQSH